MKIIVNIPDVGHGYGDVHQTIARSLQGLMPEIRQGDCATHPENYALVATDKRSNGESWSQFAILSFKHRPGTPPPRLAPEKDEDYEARCLLEREDEERAMGQALELAGVHFNSETPQSAHSPTGRPFNGAVDISIYDKTILVTQYGGIDC